MQNVYRPSVKIFLFLGVLSNLALGRGLFETRYSGYGLHSKAHKKNKMKHGRKTASAVDPHAAGAGSSADQDSDVPSGDRAISFVNSARVTFGACQDFRLKQFKLINLAAGLIGKDKFFNDLNKIIARNLEAQLKATLAAYQSGNQPEGVESQNEFGQVSDYILHKLPNTKQVADLISELKAKPDDLKNCGLEETAPEFTAVMDQKFDNELGDRKFASKAEALKFFKDYLTKISAAVQSGQIQKDDPQLWYLNENSHMISTIGGLITNPDDAATDPQFNDQLESLRDSIAGPLLYPKFKGQLFSYTQFQRNLTKGGQRVANKYLPLIQKAAKEAAAKADAKEKADAAATSSEAAPTE